MKFFQVHPFMGKKPLWALASRACPRLNESLHLLWRSHSVWWWEVWEELLPAPLSSKQRGLSGSLAGRQNYLGGRGPGKNPTCLEQILKEFVMPQPKRTLAKGPVYVPEFMGTWASFVSKLLLLLFPEMQPSRWMEQLNSLLSWKDLNQWFQRK